ncbi:MAG: magnesium transporter [Candidatus Saccharibacteria bacterium]|nr:magnesium transporter [Candidatus Saccharibacteria bacterium]
MKFRKQLPTLNLNPVALADVLFRKDNRTSLFLSLDADKRVDMLRSVTKSVRRELLMKSPEEELVTILQSLDPDEATDMLQSITKNKREKVLALLSQELKDSLSTLLAFDPDTAAGLMTLDYIQADVSDNIESVAKKFMNHEKRTGRPPVILVLTDNRLSGFLPGHALGLAAKSELIGKFVKRLPSISYAARHREVIDLFQRHPHSKVAVLNDSGEVVGIIYSDDILQIIQSDQASSLYNFAGIRQEESVTDSAKSKVKNRYRWLIINLGTAFLASFTVSLFDKTISKYVLLAVYMPIVAGMGGNAATQTLAVQVRGISLRQIELKNAWGTLKNELGASLVNGLINGIIVAAVVIFVNHDVKIAIVLGFAMIINLLVAGLFGTMVPLIMKKLGKDPATSATIFITTATDILGFMAFLGLATLILA